ncbi:hypothetical protein [Candidatus Ichthyocystis sparus]|uniref:hypothetical protein n=1 Tax=Candidatus Ichthyocystis sparus TaxID=1561004 RepID=UPI00159ED9C3|nr:hypothetical protein [Candidatus Ichthyocystis sparus]
MTGFDSGEDVCIALDCASSQFYSDGHYKIFNEFMNSDDFSSYLDNLCSCFPIVST